MGVVGQQPPTSAAIIAHFGRANVTLSFRDSENYEETFARSGFTRSPF